MFEKIKKLLPFYNQNTRGAYQGATTEYKVVRPSINIPVEFETLDRLEVSIRGKDFARNIPGVSSIVDRTEDGVVGSGLVMKPNLNPARLGIEKKELKESAIRIEQHWSLFNKKFKLFDYDNFGDMQRKAFRSFLLDGDFYFFIDRSRGFLEVKIIEGCSVYTPKGIMQSDVIDGVIVDEKGIARQIIYNHYDDINYTVLNLYDRNGRKIIHHVANDKRPRQYRGMPFLYPIIHAVTDLEKFRKAELDGAIVASLMMAVFTERQAEGGGGGHFTKPSDGNTSGNDFEIKLQSGGAVKLPGDLAMQMLESKRPNKDFKEFYQTIFEDICASISLPAEVVRMCFDGSYSASRAAIKMAEGTFLKQRKKLIDSFCQVVYEEFLDDLHYRKVIELKGFDDDIMKMEWAKANWFGTRLPHIDPEKEAKAFAILLEMGGITYEQFYQMFHGSDFGDFEERFKVEAPHRKEFFNKKEKDSNKKEEVKEEKEEEEKEGEDE